MIVEFSGQINLLFTPMYCIVLMIHILNKSKSDGETICASVRIPLLLCLHFVMCWPVIVSFPGLINLFNISISTDRLLNFTIRTFLTSVTTETSSAVAFVRPYA